MLQRLSPLLVATALLLTGCASAAPVNVAGPSASATTPIETPTATPTTAGALSVGVDGVEFAEGAESQSFPFDEPEPLLSLIEELTGEPRQGEDFEDPWGNGEVVGAIYRWDDISVSVMEEGPASVAVLAPTVGDVPIRTESGIAVGDAREAVLAAGGWDEWDEDGDGVADNLGIDAQEVEGTQSLSRPGEIGREYVLVVVDDDVVSRVQSPANDFSDL